MPLFDVPDPPLYTLTRAPLVQALAQVRYPLIASLESMTGIAPLQGHLLGAFPYMEQEKVQEVAIVLGPAGPAASGGAESVVWKLTNDDGETVVVGAGSATLSVGSSYRTVEDFAAKFEILLEALAKIGVPRCDRLGVRYLSVAAGLPGVDRAWRDWFRSELLGWAGSDVIPEGSLQAAISQVKLAHDPTGDLAGPPAEVQGTIRYGAVPSGSTVPGVPPVEIEDDSFLLDLDISSAGHQRFDTEELLRQFGLFHQQIDRFFYWALTEKGGEHFGLEARDS